MIPQLSSTYRNITITSLLSKQIAFIKLQSKSAFNFTGKPTGKGPVERPKLRWENNIRMDLKEIDINTRNLVDSAQDKGLL